MKISTKKAISFVLVLSLLLSMSGGSVFAISGTNPKDEGTVQEIGTIEYSYSVENGPMMTVSGISATGDGQVLAEIYQMSPEGTPQLVVGTSTIPEGDGSFTINDFNFSGPLSGEYFMILCNEDYGDGGLNLETSYRVVFEIKDDELEPGWDDPREDYDLQISPASIELEDLRYGATSAGVTFSVDNVGLESLTNMEVKISGAGFSIEPTDSVAELKSGESSKFTVTASDGLTPGAYEATILAKATGASTDDTNAQGSVSIRILKTTNPGILPAFTTVAATTVGGLGQISNLSGSAVYEIISTEADGTYPTWTSITADASGVVKVTPGAFQLRLPETDFYLPGTPSDEFVVKALYHFEGHTFENTKAGTYQEFDLNDYVSGGVGTKVFEVTGGGILPPGLNLDETAGIISGTPSAVTTGSFTVPVSVTDSEEGTKLATFIFDQIIKGDQATPSAVELGATDHIIFVTGSAIGQLYYVSTDGALAAFNPVGWTSETAIEGLDRNTKYYVYSKFPATELLNESPVASPEEIYTLKTTIASVSLTRAGVDATTVAAIVTPTDAAVEYQWMLDGVTIPTVTSSTITITEDMAGKELKVLVNGIGDFQGQLTSGGIMVGGVSVKLTVNSWNPGVPVAAILTNENGVAVTCTALSSTEAGIVNSLTTQSVTIANVRPNQSYKLVLSKAGCTDVIVNGITVADGDLTFTSSLCDQMIMYCGDLNGDNSIRLEDRATLLMSRYYNKTIQELSGDETAAACDFNGDGRIDFEDLCLMMGSANFGKDGLVISY